MNKQPVKLLILLSFAALAVIGGYFYFLRPSQPEGSAAVTERQSDKRHAEAVVSGHELATEAGFKVLEAGGTAADAAVAVAAALSVVEPWFSSALGGGTWALYYEAETGKVTSLDGVGPVGSKATVASYSNRPELDMNQAVVPGAWDGWMLWLDHYGELDLPQVLEPAIEIAREGYEVTESMAYWLGQEKTHLIPNREFSRRIYMPEGRILEEGDTVYQNDMADTFEALANAYEESFSGGRSAGLQAARDYFYRGPIAQSLVNFSDERNGYLTLEDFHNFEAEIVEPISIDYKDGIEVFQNPPNSQGITMLLALNILKDYDFSGLSPDDATALHMQVEAIKLAFADRYYHIGDPDRVEVRVADLLSEAHALKQRGRIDMERAMNWPISDVLDPVDPDDTHTTTFHIVDRFGNAAAVTTSLGAQFLVAGDTGIHINNRMRMLSLEEGNPNELTPGFKVRHTSNPYMALKNGKPYILGGNTGVDTQPQGQTQQFMHVVEFGLSPQEAVTRPRFVSTSFPASTPPYNAANTLQMESGFRDQVVEELKELGHSVSGGGVFGSANMIVIDGDDVSVGAETRDSSFGRVVLPK